MSEKVKNDQKWTKAKEVDSVFGSEHFITLNIRRLREGLNEEEAWSCSSLLLEHDGENSRHCCVTSPCFQSLTPVIAAALTEAV